MTKTYETIPPRPVAFIGLGVMGHAMAGHLARAGHRVTVYNPSRHSHSPPQKVVVAPGKSFVLGFRW